MVLKQKFALGLVLLVIHSWQQFWDSLIIYVFWDSLRCFAHKLCHYSFLTHRWQKKYLSRF
jgi:hypothetical protein